MEARSCTDKSGFDSHPPLCVPKYKVRYFMPPEPYAAADYDDPTHTWFVNVYVWVGNTRITSKIASGMTECEANMLANLLNHLGKKVDWQALV